MFYTKDIAKRTVVPMSYNNIIQTHRSSNENSIPDAAAFIYNL